MTDNNSNATPLVSVVIPFYANLEWLIEAVDSVLEQTYKNLEIIVINDGSHENVDTFMFKYREKIVYYFKENGGSGSARNYGIDIAKGKYIAFLDSDDLWLPEKLERQVEQMENGKLAWSHCSYETFGDGPHYISDASELNGYVFPKAMINSRIGTPCVIIRSSILKDNPTLRFNEQMRRSQDVYMWTVMSREFELGSIKEILCRVRMRKNISERSAFLHITGRGQLWDEINKLEDPSKYTSMLPAKIRKAYILCSKRRRYLINLKNGRVKNYLLEMISGILYIKPYITFKRYSSERHLFDSVLMYIKWK